MQFETFVEDGVLVRMEEKDLRVRVSAEFEDRSASSEYTLLYRPVWTFDPWNPSDYGYSTFDMNEMRALIERLKDEILN